MIGLLLLTASRIYDIAIDTGGVQEAIAPVIIAGAIGAAASIGNAIFGSSSARRQQREQLAALRKQREEENALYQRRINEDATQRADAQRMLTRANNAIKQRTMAAYGRKAVVGGTDASMASVQQANAEQIGNALGDITARADARKDAIEDNHQKAQSNYAQQESSINANAEAAKRNAVAQAATGVVQSAASVVGSMGDSGTLKSPTSKAISKDSGDAMSIKDATKSTAIKDSVKKSAVKIYDPTDPKFGKFGNIFDLANKAR